MKNLKSLFAVGVLLFGLGFTSCSKDEDTVVPETPEHPIAPGDEYPAHPIVPEDGRPSHPIVPEGGQPV